MIILVICCLSLFIVGLDNTIVNVALPSISRGLGASVSGLQWIVDGYTMVLASLVMSAGATADRFGRRQVFRAGLMVFTVSSALCSVAPSLGWLIAFRVLQAIGGSMLNPVAVSIISSVFKGRAERAWAIGVWVTMFGVSMALGPVFGGVLTAAVGWRSIFWVNIPVGLIAIVLVSKFIPESRAEVKRRLDLVAQLLVIVMLGSLIYAIIEGAPSDWREPGIRALFGLAGFAALVLVWWELRRKDPMIDPRSFRNLPFTGAVLTGICSFGSLGGFLFLITIYLQEARGLSALHAGLHMLPAAAAMAICPLPAAWLAARRGLWLPLSLGGLALMLSMIAMSRLTVTSGELYLIAAFTLFGIGLGMVDGQISHAAVSAMPSSKAGVAAGIASASRQVGQALGVAVTGALLNAGLHGPVRTDFVTASRSAWLVLTGCGCVVFLLGLTTIRARLPERDLEPAADGPPAAPRRRPRYSGKARPAPRLVSPLEPTPSPVRALSPGPATLPMPALAPEPATLPMPALSPAPTAAREPAAAWALAASRELAAARQRAVARELASARGLAASPELAASREPTAAGEPALTPEPAAARELATARGLTPSPDVAAALKPAPSRAPKPPRERAASRESAASQPEPAGEATASRGPEPPRQPEWVWERTQSREPEPSWGPPPSRDPEPSWKPEPEPAPEPTASREPEPSWGPPPSRESAPSWKQEPEPAREPSPAWQPEPVPEPAASREPTPSPEPEPSWGLPASREPEPSWKHEPEPAREPSPAWAPEPAPELSPEPEWIPPEPPRRPPPRYPAPASGNPTVITRREQVYYRRQWRADSEQSQSLPAARLPVAEAVEKTAEHAALAGQRRGGWRRDGALPGDRPVVVGAGDGVHDLGLSEVLGPFDLRHVTDQHAVPHDLGFQASRAVGVPLRLTPARQRHTDAELAAAAAQQMRVDPAVT
jgi:EmrB/QacA subfamily drug resistance transporter